MFKLQVKFPGEDWAPTVYPARDKIAAEKLLSEYNKLWGHVYSYRLIDVTNG